MSGSDGQIMASPLVGFRARAPWWGPDLQTLRNHLGPRPADLAAWPQRDLVLPLGDGSGDRLAAALHRPETATGPLVVLVHGLTGCADSSYLRATARQLLLSGFPVLRLSLRGAGPSRPLCSGQYHAGRSEDLRAVLLALKGEVEGLSSDGLVLVGYSLGANMLLKYLGENEHPLPVRAAASISAPIDLKAAQQRIMAPRNGIYHSYLLRRMKAESLEGPVPLTVEEAQAVRSLRSIYEFDDRVVAPRGGFDSAEDYYARCSARHYLAAITVPTLFIHAQDDPWIPFASYRAIDWQANPSLHPSFPTGGGHVGFHDRAGPPAWHDRAITGFFERIL